MSGEQEAVYVVAPGTTVYTPQGVFPAGAQITAADVGSLQGFRALLAAGKIQPADGSGEEGGDGGGEWNYTSIDSELDAASPNPVENRVITRALAEIQNSMDGLRISFEASAAELNEVRAEPIPPEQIKTEWEKTQQEA